MIKLSCKSCGAKLELTDDIDRFACAHCGVEWIVNRSGGIVNLKSVEESLNKIEKNTEGTEKHTQVLANQVKAEKIKEQIRYLQNQRDRISPEPTVDNPDYIRRQEEIDREIKVIESSDRKRRKPFIIVLIICMILSSTVYCSITKNPRFSGGFEDLCYLFYIIMIFIGVVSFITICRSSRLPANTAPKKIIDQEQYSINTKQIQDFNTQIEDLRTKAKEIEESFLNG